MEQIDKSVNSFVTVHELIFSALIMTEVSFIWNPKK